MQEPKGPVPAIGIIVQARLGDKLVLTLQTHYDQEESLLGRAVLQDALMADMQRLMDLNQIKQLEAAIEFHQRQMDATKEQEARAAQTYFTETEARAKKLDNIIQKGASAWAEAGKHGEYKPSGADAQRMQRLTEEQKKADEERQAALRNMAAGDATNEENIRKAKLEIAQLRERVDAPYSGTNR